MLEHLISYDLEPLVCPAEADDFVGLTRSTVDAVIDAQVNTANWLEATGLLDDTPTEASTTTAHARTAFAALTGAPTAEQKMAALTTLTMPEEVRRVVGMLSAYDWEFVHQAKELRAFVVARLVEECQGSRAGDRIKALQALGKVTEVGLFTEKVEIKNVDMSEEEVNARIKDKIAAFLKIEDAQITDVIANDPIRHVEPE